MGKAKQKYIRALQKFQRTPETQRGTLGNVLGQVAVPNQPDMVYVIVAGLGVRQVKNTKVANIPGTPVKVGYDPLEPNIFQVLDTVSYPQTYNAPQYTNSVGTHGSTHNWAGNDTVWVEKRQLMPLRITPIGAMNLFLSRDIVWQTDRWVYHGGATINMSAAIPATGSRYALIYAGATGSYGILTGTVRDLQTMVFSDLPDPLPGTIPTAIIRLYAGQTGISEGLNDTDIVDVRGLFTPVGGGLSGITGALGSEINLDTANFNNNLSAADTTVQLALETLDELTAGVGLTNPMTHLNDIIFGGISGVAQRLGSGSNSQVLTLVSGTMNWENPTGGIASFHGAKAYNDANITVPNNTNGVLTLNTEDYDTDGYHSTTGSTERFTIPTGLAGYYRVTANIEWYFYTDLGVRSLSLHTNTTQIARIAVPGTPTTTLGTALNVSMDVYLAAGDYVYAIASQVTGGESYVIAYDHFSPVVSIVLIGT